MQTISLYENQTIAIGNELELTFLGMRRGKIHFRITSPMPVRPSDGAAHNRRGSTIAIIPIPRNPRYGG